MRSEDLPTKSRGAYSVWHSHILSSSLCTRTSRTLGFTPSMWPRLFSTSKRLITWSITLIVLALFAYQVLSSRPSPQVSWSSKLGLHSLHEAESAALVDSGRTGSSVGIPILDQIFPIGDLKQTDNWENENSKSLHALLQCTRESTCTENQTSIILLSDDYFITAISGGNGGEEIW